MNFIKIKTSDDADELDRVPYYKESDGWYVNTEQVDGERNFRRYTSEEAREMDLRQLLKKDYDIRY